MIACLMYPKSYGRWALDSLCVPKNQAHAGECPESHENRITPAFPSEKRTHPIERPRRYNAAYVGGRLRYRRGQTNRQRRDTYSSVDPTWTPDR